MDVIRLSAIVVCEFLAIPSLFKLAESFVIKSELYPLLPCMLFEDKLISLNLGNPLSREKNILRSLACELLSILQRTF